MGAAARRIRWVPLLWIAGLTGIVVFLIVFHLPKEIDRSYPGIVYEPESRKTFVETTHLKGTQYRSLFGRDSFVGEVGVGELSYEFKMYDDNSTDYWIGIIIKEGASPPNFEVLGSVNVSPDFDNLWIHLKGFNEVYGMNHGYFASHAETIEEANAVVSTILKGKSK